MFASKPRKERGLTLLEVLVAMTLATIGLALILQGFGSNLGSLSVSSRYGLALQLAKERMLDLEMRATPTPGVQEGEGDETRPGMRWRTEVSEEEPKGFHRALVQVRFDSHGSEREVSLRSLLAIQTSASR